MKWDATRKESLRSYWSANLGKTEIARRMNTTVGAISGAAIRLNLHNRGLRGHVTLDTEHTAVREARTLFPHTVVDGDDAPLKPGAYQRKLGRTVTKGAWKGFPIFSLSLEERATCPKSCREFSTCYGNSMPWARRMKHGAVLLSAIWKQLAELDGKHPDGFVVRLHLLGDFYSTEYVRFWQLAILAYPALHVFGYTAWQAGTEIGDAVNALRSANWDRFAVRTSGAASGPRTIVIDTPIQRREAIICPVETGRADTCASCSLCWASQKPIAFLRH